MRETADQIVGGAGGRVIAIRLCIAIVTVVDGGSGVVGGVGVDLGSDPVQRVVSQRRGVDVRIGLVSQIAVIVVGIRRRAALGIGGAFEPRQRIVPEGARLGAGGTEATHQRRALADQRQIVQGVVGVAGGRGVRLRHAGDAAQASVRVIVLARSLIAVPGTRLYCAGMYQICSAPLEVFSHNKSATPSPLKSAAAASFHELLSVTCAVLP